MPEKRLNEIPRNLRELYEKGNAALGKKNYDYALALYNQVLQGEPGFYECREALRATQFHKAGTGTSFFKKVFGTASSSPQIAKAQFLVRSNPREALGVCEQILNGDPGNATAHKILAEAAMAEDFPKSAVLSLEILYKNSPKDREIVLRLGAALAAAGNVARAETVVAELQRANPNDQEIAQARKDIAAKRTLHEAGYNELASGEGSYRDILKDKEQAAILEQEQRQVKTEDVAAELLAEYKARLEKEPENRRVILHIADLHLQRKEFDKALGYFNRLSTGPGGADPAVEKAIANAKIKQIEHEITLLDPNDPESAAKEEQLRARKQEFAIADAKARVEKYPNDLAFRFDLGVLLYKAGRIGEAIQEFQKAQNNPHKKIQSLYYLGLCFSQRNMNDIAARSLQGALAEKVVFDDEKKELIYALAMVLEKMGRKEESIEELKKVYEVDIGYKDVAKRVDEYYAGGAG